MFHATTLKRIATTAVAALAIAAGAASSASADDLPITADPDPNVISCNWTGPQSFMCKFGKTIVACSKSAWGPEWSCGSSQCGCSAAEEQPADERELRMMIAVAEPYATRLAARAAPAR